tara:strand:+ start:153 stop:524 length:372 start_codon:yes stop_codon:yes gene_type:complete
MNKLYIEILLVFLLFLTIHTKCKKIIDFSNTALGKAFALLIIFLLTENYGLHSGFLAALLLILLLYKSDFQEFFSNFPTNDVIITREDLFHLERKLREQSERQTLSASCAYGGERFGAVHRPF